MKKILLLFTMVAAHYANAQSLGFGIRGGANFNTIGGENAYKSAKADIGYHAGVFYESNLAPLFAFETSAYVDTRGFKMEESTSLLGQQIASGEAKLKATYLNASVALKLKAPMGAASKFFVSAGLFGGMGLSAKMHLESDLPLVGKQKTSEEIKFGDGVGQLSQFNYGLTFAGGFELSHFIIYGGYDLGLSETAKDSGVKFNAAKVGVGVKF